MPASMEPARATGLTELYMARYIYTLISTLQLQNALSLAFATGRPGPRIIRDPAKIPRSGAPPFHGSPARFTAFFPRLFGGILAPGVR